MERRYIIILPARTESERYWQSRIADLAPYPSALRSIVNSPRLIVLSSADAYRLAGAEGVILGELIRKGGRAPIPTLDTAETELIARFGAERLITGYWGAYLAVIVCQDEVTVLRAPLGDLPAYVWHSPHGMVIGSDVALISAIGGFVPSIDWTAVAEHLVAPDLRRARTCLADLEELAGGAAGTWRNDRWAVRHLWSPWQFVSPDPDAVDPIASPEQVAQAVRQSIAARTARLERLILLLSGGLDSSIVAACLADAGRETNALTMVTRDRGGDERAYARAIASHLAIPLTEVTRAVTDVDIYRSAAAGLPRPSEHSFAQATSRAAELLSNRTGAQAIVHGGGGDNVFCSVQSAAPVADWLLTAGPDRRFREIAADLATLSQTSIPHVIQAAVRRAFRRRQHYRFPADRSLLSREAIAAARNACEHPWLDSPRRALPGSASHIGLVAAAQSLVESPDPRPSLARVAPLVTQPVIETCVAIPSWNWYLNGCNRAVARQGFQRSLPAEIAWRRSKGAMDSFVIEIMDANRRRLNAMLGDGLLVAHGLLDRDAVRGVLADGISTSAQDCGRVMLFADVEAWLRSWSDN